MSSIQHSSFSKQFTSLEITGIQLTGKILGKGSDATVKEVNWVGTSCAAKQLHEILLEDDSPGGAKRFVDNFEKECLTWSKLIHPHIVQFLGVYFLSGSRVPMLILEKMDTSLRHYLENRTKENFVLPDKIYVFHQVAQALSYLHSRSPPLVHHDLSPNNVLLNEVSLQAKVTDFGMTRAIDPSKMTRKSSAKGTQAFMPPEALHSPPKYDEKLDVFSYGNVIVTTVIHDWPEPGPPTKYEGDKLIGLTEFQRRKQYLDRFNQIENNLFLPIVSSCLENRPHHRPSSFDLVTRIREIEGSHPRLMATSSSTLQLSRDQNHLHEELTIKENTIRQKDAQLKQKDVQLKQQTAQLEQRDAQLREQDVVLKQQHTLLQQKDAQLKQKDEESGRQYAILLHENQQLQQERDELRRERHQLQQESSRSLSAKPSPPRHLSAPTEEPDTFVPTTRVDGVPVAKPRTKLKSYPVASLQPSRSVTQPEIEPSDEQMDIKHKRVQAITGISDELLEESGQLDSIGECTEEEEDLTSLDEMSRQAFTIQNEWLSEFNPIGKGAFGEVFHALLRYAPSANPIEVAVKTVKPSASKAERENFQKEVQIMATLLHPNVVKMFGIIEDPESCTVRVVLEFLHKGDLRTYLQKSKTKPSVKRLVKFMFDVASGMHYIASKGLVHRFLAACNVLVSNDEVCKVADFRLLRHVKGEQELYRAQNSLRLPARWMAPESLTNLCFSLASDVWSFGILIWEMFHPEEKCPYPSLSNQAVMLKVPQGYTMDIPKEAPPTVHNIMKQCWHLLPENRPNFLLISSLLCKCHLQLSPPSHLSAPTEEPDTFVPTTRVDGVPVPKPQTKLKSYPVASLQPSRSVTQPEIEPSDEQMDTKHKRVQAITGISDELLEESGQLDSIGECTEEEEDLTSFDEMSRQAFTIQNEWLSEFNPIGKGAFGEVFHALLRYTPSANPIEVAVKTVKPSASRNFQKEVQTMATLLHPNVVKMFGVIEDPESCTVRVVMEFLHKGDLRTYLQKSKTKPSVKHLVKFMYDVASGMHYIASKGLVHRDLAARNVLVSNDEVCKVADFDLLRHVEGEQELYRAQGSHFLPARWMAPECLSDLCFSLASDVWSFGILMWEMFHPEEKYPYPSLSNQAVMLKVPQGYTMDIPKEAPPTVHKLMKQCWHLFPENRPSFLLISTLLCKCHLQLV